MTDSENAIDLKKLRDEIERAKRIFSDPKAVKERKKRAEERFKKKYLVKKRYHVKW